MTDFSRNQITSTRLKSGLIDRWVIPNDRQLALRAKLGIGWCVRSNRTENFSIYDEQSHNLTDEELNTIRSVIQKSRTLEEMERDRVGCLVSHYRRLKEQSNGDGITSCLLCGADLQKFRAHVLTCSDCRYRVCSQCSVDIVNHMKNKVTLCKLCGEKRELWKRSGAWFLGSLPPHNEISSSSLALSKYETRSLGYINSSGATPRGKYSSVPSSPMSHSALDQLDDPDRNHVVISRSYKRGISSYSDDSSSVASSAASYDEERRQYLKPDADSTSSSHSIHLTNTPLLSAAFHKSKTSLVSAEAEEQKKTGNSPHASNLNLHLISLKPNTSDDLSMFVQEKKTPHTQVTFPPEATLTEEPTPQKHIPLSPSSYTRCVSLPNAELEDVQYAQEDDQDSPYGSIQFTVFYNERICQLNIELLKAQHLPDTEYNHSVYVNLNLAPSVGNSRKQRSRTESNFKEPKWNQMLTYHGVSMEDLLLKSLVFSVMQEHKIGSDTVVGEFRLPLRPLKSYELSHYHVYLEKKVRLPTDEAVTGDDRGKVLLSLRYNSAATQLYVAVIRCAALHIPNSDALADPYVKIYLQPDYSKSSKKKTVVVKRTLNPEFQEEFIYKLEKHSLEKRSLEVTVWNHGMMQNTFLGGVCLSLTSSSASEKIHWANVLNQPDRRHDSWHVLRDIATK